MYWESFDLQGIILQVLKRKTCSDMQETHSPVSVCHFSTWGTIDSHVGRMRMLALLKEVGLRN